MERVGTHPCCPVPCSAHGPHHTMRRLLQAGAHAWAGHLAWAPPDNPGCSHALRTCQAVHGPSGLAAVKGTGRLNALQAAHHAGFRQVGLDPARRGICREPPTVWPLVSLRSALVSCMSLVSFLCVSVPLRGIYHSRGLLTPGNFLSPYVHRDIPIPAQPWYVGIQKFVTLRGLAMLEVLR